MRTERGPTLPDNALAQQLATQRDWLAGGRGGFVRGLDAVVVGELDWTDLDEEWRVRALSAAPRIDSRSARADLVVELRAERLTGRTAVENRLAVLAELPLLQENGTIVVKGGAVLATQRMVRTDGPWPRFAGPSTFAVLGERSGDATIFAKRRGVVVVGHPGHMTPLSEVERALADAYANPYTPEANLTARRLKQIELSPAGAARWARHVGAPQSAGAISPDAIIAAAKSYLSGAVRRPQPVVLDGEAPDWRLLSHVERLEHALDVALLGVRSSWTMRRGKQGISGKEIFRTMVKTGDDFDDALAKLAKGKAKPAPVFDVFDACAEAATADLLRKVTEPLSGRWSADSSA